jgi:glycosyltransferase involved in cell wall biosynthesis
VTEPGTTLPLAGVRIGHVGRQPDYTRDRIVAKALRRVGAEVVAVGAGGRFPRRWLDSARARWHEHFDALLVSTLGQADVPLHRMASAWKRTPVVFDASIALYETLVESRASARAGSVRARSLALQDLLACRLAHEVLIDTETHLSYMSARTHTPVARFARIWLGADDEVMSPRPRHDDGPFRVLFYGTYSPLHGAQHIVRAAAQLSRSHDDLEFLMVGSGHTDGAIRQLADDLRVESVRFTGRVRHEDLPALIAASDVCLGIFGSIAPAARVIPFKVFDALAMARPVVTADTPAAREALVDGIHCRLCPPGDPAALADVLLELKRDEDGARDLARRGHARYRERFSLDAQSGDLARVFNRLLAR